MDSKDKKAVLISFFWALVVVGFFVAVEVDTYLNLCKVQ